MTKLQNESLLSVNACTVLQLTDLSMLKIVLTCALLRVLQLCPGHGYIVRKILQYITFGEDGNFYFIYKYIALHTFYNTKDVEKVPKVIFELFPSFQPKFHFRI